MSVEAPKPVEETPAVDSTKALPEQPETTAAPSDIAATTTAAEATAATEATPSMPAESTAAAPAAATEEIKKDEAAIVEAVPATEGDLGYKEPSFFKYDKTVTNDSQYTSSILTTSFHRKFIYRDFHFWLQDEPATAESLSHFVRTDKGDTRHADAAWARETGKGLLFYSKRSEDKATPTGIINLVSSRDFQM
jgi:hypothetical protein